MNPSMIWLTVCSAGHFWTDFSCALLMFSRLYSGPERALCVLLYNFCAFALQMPFGLIADRLNRNSRLAAAGFLLVTAAWGLSGIPVLCAVTAGIGNAFFHVGAGLDVLNMDTEHCGRLGIFTAPGAMGVFLGTLAGQSGFSPALLPLLGLAGLLLPFLDRRLRGAGDSGNAPLDLTPSGAGTAALVFCFFMVYAQNLTDALLSFSWRTGAWAVAAACAVFLGKTAGGCLADLLGRRRTAVLTLGGAAVLFLFSSAAPAGVLAVFLFNMTVPVVFHTASRILPGAKGFSFGLLKFALFLGFLTAWLGLKIPLPGWAAYAGGCLLCLLLLLGGLRKAEAA